VTEDVWVYIEKTKIFQDSVPCTVR